MDPNLLPFLGRAVSKVVQDVFDATLNPKPLNPKPLNPKP